MMNEEKVVQDLSKLFGSWEFSYIDAIGIFGGEHYGVEKRIFYLN